MAAYIIRRLLQMIPTLIGVVLLVFFLFKYFGGDPAEILGGLNATPQQIDAIREQLGLNEPWWVQLWIYLKGIVTLDWGRSWATNEAVSNIFATRLPATLTVMFPILILDTLIALPIAIAVLAFMLATLGGIAASASKFSHDMRLLQHLPGEREAVGGEFGDVGIEIERAVHGQKMLEPRSRQSFHEDAPVLRHIL